MTTEKTTAKFYYKNPEAPKPNRPVSLGVVAIIEHGDKVLMERRADCDRWCFIGGSMDDDESVHTTIVREVKEETGLEIVQFELFGIFSDPSRIIQYPDGNIIRSVSMVYRVTVANADQAVRSEESNELSWVTLEQANALDVVETHRHILDAYLAGATLVLD